MQLITALLLLIGFSNQSALAEHVQTCDELLVECVDLRGEMAEAMFAPGSFKNGSYIDPVLEIMEESALCLERLDKRECWSTFSEN